MKALKRKKSQKKTAEPVKKVCRLIYLAGKLYLAVRISLLELRMLPLYPELENVLLSQYVFWRAQRNRA